jgi:hypothetical protein
MAENAFHVHQIHYAAGQKEALDPAFIPYDNADSPKPSEHEFHVFRKEYLAGNTREGLTGFLSWKFVEKSGLRGEDFLRFCRENPGHDVYFVNPFPIEICFGNIWQQGEMWTPGITALAQQLLDACGYGINLQMMPRRLSSLAYCNYWIGTPRFWDRYMAFCLPLYDHLHNNPEAELTRRILSQGDPGRKTTYFSFIFERLFSTLLASDPQISFAAYRYSRAELRQRYPGRYADFLAGLRLLEEQHPEDPEPIRRSPRHQRLLARQEQAARLLNRPWLRAWFNRQWPRWQASRLRTQLSRSPRFEAREMVVFFLLNPAYVHWRRDLPGRVRQGN